MTIKEKPMSIFSKKKSKGGQQTNVHAAHAKDT